MHTLLPEFAQHTREFGMGEWKVQVSIRVRQALRAELEEFAVREKRKMGNLAELILEWGFEQLKKAGSSHQLMKYKVPQAGDKKAP